jgi:hypothetical protein
MMRMMYKLFDYVTRRFNASSAEPKKPEGAGPSLEPPLSAIARIPLGTLSQPK